MGSGIIGLRRSNIAHHRRSWVLDNEFKRQRAQTVRELAELVNDSFVKGRLLALVSRYDDNVTARTPLTPIDLKSQRVAAGTLSRRYLTLAKHSFNRSSSERTCDSMAPCSATVPLLNNSPEALLSRFCFQSRIACLVAVWASDPALRYVFVQASAIEHVLHS